MFRKAYNKAALAVAMLLLVSCLINVGSSFDPDSLVDNIVLKHHAKLLEDVASGKLVAEEEVQEVAEMTPLPGYQCKHDHHLSGVMKNIVPKIDKMVAQSTPVNGGDFVEVAAATASNRQPIRILFDKSTLDNDKYACYTVGQKVAVGLDSGSDSTRGLSSCSGSDDNACIYTCRQQDLLTPSMKRLITDYILPTMSEVFGSVILVDRNEPDVLKFNQDIYNTFSQQCNYGVNVPSTYVTNGAPNTDHVVFVTVRPTTDTSTIAYAMPCNFDVRGSGFYGRPKASGINFNPSYFYNYVNKPTGFRYREYVRVGIHEMTHSLGFSNFFYNSFTTSRGARYNAASEIRRKGTSPAGERFNAKKFAIVSPNVVNFVRDHYDCDSIGYAELEDAGGAGTSGSHWEKRTAGEEYMLGFVSPLAPITNLTLSLLKDTGWYDIDYSHSEKLVFGKNLGCRWLDQCSDNTWNYQGYFCTNNGDVGCTATRMGKGVCLLGYGSLKPEYQHFKNPRLGGLDSVADNCPYYQVYDEIDTSQYCVNEEENSTLEATVGEVFGSNSRCFEFTSGGDRVRHACWQMKCNGKNIDITIGGQVYTCYDGQAQQTINVNGMQLKCPFGGLAECGGRQESLDVAGGNTSSTLFANAKLTFALMLIVLCTYIVL
ncbi:hypothetical protein SAMD00019534_034120 [Acytostelium subglobosum LB1]|uniref:hypothetical protein n=1 Tax=Acytostelium subglobosum LB1 TaxID=1410327 RepID=UPI0006449D2A|nr:hypothetical protein SAMD00019534_034120 [Acytostelium subglobosum LB1]GAM20237.1 hypothetical protein SAMD00019534_034120 [Acytostelium subglobosum LB1]|eukprot:XP_012759758.1 hypothetical protein SAMD00019534_034120 [Acytostelium subglobosum LB1]